MMDLATLIQIALVAFLVWGGVLSLLVLAWTVRPGSKKVFSYAAANDFETDFRRVLSRSKAAAAI
jgi:cbb3-type cytochrome oxidase subunit 3